MAEILFSSITEPVVHAAIEHQAHAVLLVAPVGAGKATVADYIAGAHLGKLDNHAYFRRLGQEGPITVEDIRGIKQLLSLKTTGRGDIRRVIVIEHADGMNDESQNALLKSLEEPPVDTVIILCADDIHGLRETIRSRSQTIHILPPTKEVLADHFKALGFSSDAIEKAYRISGGLVGLMYAMLQDDTEHPLAVQIEQAKQLLGATQFDRLKRVDELSKQKQETKLLLAALKRISSSALEQAALKGQEPAVKRWHSTLSAVDTAEAQLRHNPSLKLLLTDLFLHL